MLLAHGVELVLGLALRPQPTTKRDLCARTAAFMREINVRTLKERESSGDFSMKFEHNSQGLSTIFLQFAGELSLVGLHMNILNTGHQKSTICKSKKMRLNLRSILAKRLDFRD